MIQRRGPQEKEYEGEGVRAIQSTREGARMTILFCAWWEQITKLQKYGDKLYNCFLNNVGLIQD